MADANPAAPAQPAVPNPPSPPPPPAATTTTATVTTPAPGVTFVSDPAPGPVAAAVAAEKKVEGKIGKAGIAALGCGGCLLAIVFLVMAAALAVIAYHYLGPGLIDERTEGERLGSRLRAPALAAIAAGETAYADAVAAGDEPAAADDKLAAALATQLNGEYKRIVAPGAARVLPAGTTKFKDQDQRAQVEAFHRGVARGLKEGR